VAGRPCTIQPPADRKSIPRGTLPLQRGFPNRNKPVAPPPNIPPIPLSACEKGHTLSMASRTPGRGIRNSFPPAKISPHRMIRGPDIRTASFLKIALGKTGPDRSINRVAQAPSKSTVSRHFEVMLPWAPTRQRNLIYPRRSVAPLGSVFAMAGRFAFPV